MIDYNKSFKSKDALAKGAEKNIKLEKELNDLKDDIKYSKNKLVELKLDRYNLNEDPENIDTIHNLKTTKIKY